MPGEVVFDHTARIAAMFPVAVDQIVRKSAFDLERLAKTTARDKGVHDTGYLINSIYTVTSESSGYAAASAAAASSASREMEPPVPTQPVMTARVVVGASYAVYNELGTVYMPARPFLVPSAERIRPAFQEAFRQLELLLREGV